MQQHSSVHEKLLLHGGVNSLVLRLPLLKSHGYLRLFLSKQEYTNIHTLQKVVSYIYIQELQESHSLSYLDVETHCECF